MGKNFVMRSDALTFNYFLLTLLASLALAALFLLSLVCWHLQRARGCIRWGPAAAHSKKFLPKCLPVFLLTRA